MDRDIMNMLPVKMVANDTFALIDRMQDMKRESALVAVFATALLMSEHYGISPADIGAISERIIGVAEGHRPEFTAARMFIAGWE